MATELVVVGASLGGLEALQVLLRALPAKLGVPIVLVQHRAPQPTAGLREVLQAATTLTVLEPDDKQALEPERVYLAPADYHLLVEPGHLALSTEGRVQSVRPSVDVLFESAAEAYGSGVAGVILTGLARDGALGCRRIKERGGLVLVEDPRSAASGEMPSAAVETLGGADAVLPLAELALALADLCRAGGDGYIRGRFRATNQAR
jgi:two-component system chemotaxis response regulator CheB